MKLRPMEVVRSKCGMLRTLISAPRLFCGRSGGPARGIEIDGALDHGRKLPFGLMPTFPFDVGLGPTG